MKRPRLANGLIARLRNALTEELPIEPLRRWTTVVLVVTFLSLGVFLLYEAWEASKRAGAWAAVANQHTNPTYRDTYSTNAALHAEDMLQKGAIGLILVGLAAVTPIWVRRAFRRVRQGHCCQCGYDLYGSKSKHCPECGATFGPNQEAR